MTDVSKGCCSPQLVFYPHSSLMFLDFGVTVWKPKLSFKCHRVYKDEAEYIKIKNTQNFLVDHKEILSHPCGNGRRRSLSFKLCQPLLSLRTVGCDFCFSPRALTPKYQDIFCLKRAKKNMTHKKRRGKHKSQVRQVCCQVTVLKQGGVRRYKYLEHSHKNN